MSTINFPRITRQILYTEISQPQPVTAVSRLAASHHWSASSSWHRTWWDILLLQRSVTVSNSVDTELIAFLLTVRTTR